jgi:hypothetical protein
VTKAEVNQEKGRQLRMESKVFFFASVTEKAGRLGQVVNDRYRCPENFFDFVLNEELSSETGYFRFGPNAICYGRSCSGALGSGPESALYDAIGDVEVKDGKLGLPFDPTEIVENLRLERYTSTRQKESTFGHFLRRLYYRFRPGMTLSARKQIQKFHARNWRKQSFPKWPVDTTVEDVCETILLMSMEANGVKRVPFIWFWPDGASGCLAMTHDVETTAGRDYCAELMTVDDSFGFKAAFGIVPEGRYEVSASLLKSIRDRGFEVVIQDLNHDGRLFDNKKEFLRRARIINRYGCEYGAKGFRAAVLYRNPEWYDALEFTFDMSIPNVAHLDPQHGGCCTVVPYFIGDVLEIPVTTIQDYMLFHILNEYSIDLWKDQVDLILGKNGLASFIVHPDYLIQSDAMSVYKDLLSYLRELSDRKPMWFALPADIDSWWRARSKMSVVKDGNSWRIEGDVTKRARLAYARNVEGKLVYELAQAPEAAMPNRG